MNMPPPEICLRIRKLHAMVWSSSANEAETARVKLMELLSEHGLSSNDLPQILATTETINNGGETRDEAKAPDAAEATTQAGPEINVLDLVLYLLEKHIAVTAEERLAVALWILHTYIYDQYRETPRLAVLSPVNGCGKTTLLSVLELLVR